MVPKAEVFFPQPLPRRNLPLPSAHPFFFFCRGGWGDIGSPPPNGRNRRGAWGDRAPLETFNYGQYCQSGKEKNSMIETKKNFESIESNSKFS